MNLRRINISIIVLLVFNTYSISQTNLTIGTGTGYTGKTISIPVVASNMSDVVGFQFTIEYDGTQLFFLSCSNWLGGTVPEEVQITSLEGKITFVYNNKPVSISSGDFFKLTFEINSNASGKSAIKWSDDPTIRELSNSKPEAIPCTYINGELNIMPSPPYIELIQQTACTKNTGGVTLSDLPPTGNWILTRMPGAITITGSGQTKTITDLPAGTYTFSVTNSSGQTSESSSLIVIDPPPMVPIQPIIGTITQPNCNTATGSAAINGLPTTGTWILNAMPGNITSSGTGTSTIFTGLLPGTYSIFVSNQSGCTSTPVEDIVINAFASSPSKPQIGKIIHPTCNTATGSIEITGLPSTGTWQIILNPENRIIQGSGISTTISQLNPGPYKISVSNQEGCNSAIVEAVINPQPEIPLAPVIKSFQQPTCIKQFGHIILSGLPDKTWELMTSRATQGIEGFGQEFTVTSLKEGTYSFRVINSSGCSSSASEEVIIKSPPPIAIAPSIGPLSQPTCSQPKGNIQLLGLPASGTWTVKINPGEKTISGTGINCNVSDLISGTYTFTVTPDNGCVSPESSQATLVAPIDAPEIPEIGAILQPSCFNEKGSVSLNRLPSTGQWEITVNPGNIKVTGTGTETIIPNLSEGTYNFIAKNAVGCISASSNGAFIDGRIFSKPPIIEKVIQPTCSLETGSIILKSLPEDGFWSVISSPLRIIKTGTDSTVRFDNVPPGSYTFSVRNNAGCTSDQSLAVVIKTQPKTPSKPIINAIIQPSGFILTGTVVLNGLPQTGNWIVKRIPEDIFFTGAGATTSIDNIPTGNYTFSVTNDEGCSSEPSEPVSIGNIFEIQYEQKKIRSGDTIKISSADAYSFTLTINSNLYWQVVESCLWISSEKLTTSTAKITCLENIAFIRKLDSMIFRNAANEEVNIYLLQKERISLVKNNSLANARVYPNPAVSNAFLTLGDQKFKGIRITVLNMQGLPLANHEYVSISENQILDLKFSGLPSGRYFISIYDGVNIKTMEIIKL